MYTCKDDDGTNLKEDPKPKTTGLDVGHHLLLICLVISSETRHDAIASGSVLFKYRSANVIIIIG